MIISVIFSISFFPLLLPSFSLPCSFFLLPPSPLLSLLLLLLVDVPTVHLEVGGYRVHSLDLGSDGSCGKSAGRGNGSLGRNLTSGVLTIWRCDGSSNSQELSSKVKLVHGTNGVLTRLKSVIFYESIALVSSLNHSWSQFTSLDFTKCFKY